MWIVFSYDQGYEKNIRDYLDKHLEMKNNIAFSPRIPSSNISSGTSDSLNSYINQRVRL
jgi:hypothetical protein